MRRINEFKSYRSAIDYDVETGQFIVTPMPDVFQRTMNCGLGRARRRNRAVS